MKIPPTTTRGGSSLLTLIDKGHFSKLLPPSSLCRQNVAVHWGSFLVSKLPLRGRIGMFPELMPCAQETSRKLLADRKFLKIKNGRQETSQETSSDRAFVYPVFRARDSVAVLCMPRFARVWTRL